MSGRSCSPPKSLPDKHMTWYVPQPRRRHSAALDCCTVPKRFQKCTAVKRVGSGAPGGSASLVCPDVVGEALRPQDPFQVIEHEREGEPGIDRRTAGEQMEV